MFGLELEGLYEMSGGDMRNPVPANETWCFERESGVFLGADGVVFVIFAEVLRVEIFEGAGEAGGLGRCLLHCRHLVGLARRWLKRRVRN